MTLTRSPQLTSSYPRTRSNAANRATLRVLIVDDHPAVRWEPER